MPSSLVPNTMQCDVIFLLFGQRVENVYHITSPDGVDAAVLSDCADAMETWAEDQWMGVVSEDVQLLGVEVKNLSILGGGVVTRAPATTVVGSYTSPSLPGNVSFCASARTEQTGRSHRGRKYVAGVPSSQRTGNLVSSAYALQVISVLNDLVAVLSAINQVLSVVSRIQDHIVLGVAQTTPITNFTFTDLYIDSQRRRLTGRGT